MGKGAENYKVGKLRQNLGMQRRLIFLQASIRQAGVAVGGVGVGARS